MKESGFSHPSLPTKVWAIDSEFKQLNQEGEGQYIIAHASPKYCSSEVVFRFTPEKAILNHSISTHFVFKSS